MESGEFDMRMQREVLDSYDEELELELEDRPFDANGTEIALTDLEKHERRRYFAELLRLQGELVKLQDWVQATGRLIAAGTTGRASSA